MQKSKTVMVLYLVIALTLAPLGASGWAADPLVETKPTGGEMLFDAVVMRPAGAVSCVFGGLLFLVTLPITAVAGNVDEVSETLVLKPGRMTFTRPLGAPPAD